MVFEGRAVFLSYLQTSQVKLNKWCCFKKNAVSKGFHNVKRQVVAVANSTFHVLVYLSSSLLSHHSILELVPVLLDNTQY